MTFAIYTPTASTSTVTPYLYTSTSTAATSQIYVTSGAATWPSWAAAQNVPATITGNVKFALGQEADIGMPDGGRLLIRRDGSYQIDDSQARTVYKANRILEFNPFLNASDRVEEFIDYCKGFDITQAEFMALPLKTFLMWLIVEAAEADGMPEAEEAERLAIEFKTRARPRCQCGRYIRRASAAKGLLFCNGGCYDRYAFS